MSREMLARVETVKARNRVIESVPGSGYHDNDKDCFGQPRCPQKKPNPLRTGGFLPRLSDHVVAFWDARAVHFIGPDAEKVLAALKANAEALSREKKPYEMTGTEQKICEYVPGIALSLVDHVVRLSLWRDQWNDLLSALSCEGIGLTGIPLIPDGTTP